MSVLLTEQEVAEISVECALQSPCDLLFARAIQLALIEKLRKEPVGQGLFDSEGKCHHIGQHKSSMCLFGKPYRSEPLYRLPTPEELENEK